MHLTINLKGKGAQLSTIDQNEDRESVLIVSDAVYWIEGFERHLLAKFKEHSRVT